MLRLLGKLLQLFGLVILPIAVMMQISGHLSERSAGLDRMLLMSVCGVAAFFLGRFVEGYAGK